MSEHRVIVCGGRHFSKRGLLYATLSGLKPRPTLIIEGGAAGADNLAFEWAVEQGIPNKTFPAEWKKHGRAAGPIRNQQMLDEGQPHLVVEFPGGNGTADMVRRAKAAGIRVIEVGK